MQNLIALQQKEVQHLQQMQRLMMLPQMQQALHLLQLPVMELAVLVQAHLELNPLLMTDNDADEGDEELERLTDEGMEELAAEIKEERPLLFSEQDFVRLQRLHQDLYGQEERSYQEQSLRAVPTLFEHLMRQVGEMTQDSAQLAIAELLIGNLSSTGYLTTPLEELAATHSLPIKKLQHLLQMIQTLEPIGIGATTVQEALLLQLHGKQNSLAYRILTRCYQELLHNQIPQIERS